MQKRKNKNIAIGTLCALIIGMAVGYAALSQILNINGTSMISGDFSIQFTKIDENTMVNATTASKGGVGTTTATFTVDLEKPGSSAIYDLTVENKGSIDAILTSIEGLGESNLSEPLDIKFSLTGIEEGDPLNAGDSKFFQVKVVWDSNATSVPSKSKTLTLKLNYEQKTGNSGGTPTITPESCFDFKSNDGEILEYICDDTDVVIPEVIDGTPVELISDDAFANKNLTSVVIPEGVKWIGMAAFSNNQLTSVELPDSVIEIGDRAFANNQLKSVKFPQTTTLEEGESFYIMPEAFANNKLTNVEFVDGIPFEIGQRVFVNNQLETVTIGRNVGSIEHEAFLCSETSNPKLSLIINRNVDTFSMTSWGSIIRQELKDVVDDDTVTFGQVTIKYVRD